MPRVEQKACPKIEIPDAVKVDVFWALVSLYYGPGKDRFRERPECDQIRIAYHSLVQTAG